jgi:hypothetical protein
MDQPDRADAPLAANPSRLSDQDLSHLWQVHSYVNEYIRFADAKAGVAVTAGFALIAGFYSADLQVGFAGKAVCDWTFDGWLAFLAFLGLVLATIAGAIAVRPRLWNTAQEGLIFWESVRMHGSGQAYFDAVSACDTQAMGRQISEHIFSLAKVASSKYLWASASIVLVGIGGVLGILLLMFRKG